MSPPSRDTQSFARTFWKVNIGHVITILTFIGTVLFMYKENVQTSQHDQDRITALEEHKAKSDANEQKLTEAVGKLNTSVEVLKTIIDERFPKPPVTNWRSAQ